MYCSISCGEEKMVNHRSVYTSIPAISTKSQLALKAYTCMDYTKKHFVIQIRVYNTIIIANHL